MRKFSSGTANFGKILILADDPYSARSSSRHRFPCLPVAEHVPRLKYELPAYLATCAGTAYDHDDVDAFTKGVLLFGANHGKKFPTWALAMQIVGSFTPNSAAAERVFSLLKLMFGDTQMSALADMMKMALMLKLHIGQGGF